MEFRVRDTVKLVAMGGPKSRTEIGEATLIIEGGAPKQAYLEDIHVDSKAQGGGVGSALLQEAIKEAKKRGCHFIYCDPSSYVPAPKSPPVLSPSNDDKLREWYKKNGFDESVPGQLTLRL